jgi:nucleoside-diphosphate-sugar epimerase
MTASYQEELPITIVRPPAVYGPRDRDILTFFQTVKKGICPVVGGGSEKALSLVHVRDLVRGMVDAAEAPDTVGETYFIGSEGAYSWNEVKEATLEALDSWAITVPVPGPLIGAVGAAAEWWGWLTGSYPPLNREKAREIRHGCTICAVDKAQRDFGYRQQIPLEEGIRETIDWYRERDWL